MVVDTTTNQRLVGGSVALRPAQFTANAPAQGTKQGPSNCPSSWLFLWRWSSLAAMSPSSLDEPKNTLSQPAKEVPSSKPMRSYVSSRCSTLEFAPALSEWKALYYDQPMERAKKLLKRCSFSGETLRFKLRSLVNHTIRDFQTFDHI